MKMKKHLFALLAALLCMVMLMGCTAHAGPESNKLTEAESNKLTEAGASGAPGAVCPGQLVCPGLHQLL